MSKLSRFHKFWRFVKTYLPCICLFLLLYGSVARAFVIPSSSMHPTLKIGDRLIVNQLSYGLRAIGLKTTLLSHSIPERGDIVVFTRPDELSTPHTDESDMYIIKRAIGLPGETVEIRGTNVYINGKQLIENPKEIIWRLGGVKDFGPVTVPTNNVFLLGDNRDFSKDSRFWKVPFLPVKRIVGRAAIRYWPPAATL